MKIKRLFFLFLIIIIGFFSCNRRTVTVNQGPTAVPTAKPTAVPTPVKRKGVAEELLFGDYYYSNAKGIALTEDGGVLLTGSVQEEQDKTTQGSLIRLDKNNNLLWEKEIGSAGNDALFTATTTSDNAFIVAGNTKSLMKDNQNAHIVKIDANGNMLWQKNLGGDGDDDIASIIELSDKNILAAGYTTIKDRGRDGYFIKLSPSGKVIWEKNYGTQTDDTINKIKELTNGHSIAIGGGGKNTDIYILELDSKGNLIREKFLGTERMELAFDIEISPDGNYYICGYGQPENTQFVFIYVAKLSKNLEILWNKIYPGKNYSVAFDGVAEPDGSYTVAATTKNRGKIQNDDGLLFNISPKGETNWEEVFGNDNIEYLYALEKNKQGSYFMTGYVVHTSGASQGKRSINFVKYKPNK